MRLSAKGRYALAAVVSMAQRHNSGEYVTVIRISETLGISKIYLEQVFSLLKRGDIVSSVKGSQGGYQLTRMPDRITVLDVLSAVENSLFEKAADTVAEKTPDIESALRSIVFDKLDLSVQQTLKSVTLDDLLIKAETYKKENSKMYFI